ncbi:unnamed protein product [Cunninghamella echinulata]
MVPYRLFFFGNQLTDNLFQFVTNTDSFDTTNPTTSTATTYNSFSNNNNNSIPNISNPLISQLQEQQQNKIEGKNSTIASLPQQQQQQQQQYIPNININNKRLSMIDNDNRMDIKKQKSLEQQQPADQAVFTLIVGGKPFRMSWESIKSDGPTNFFMDYFLKQRNTRVMYIDRDADTFQLIVHHLRGYYIRPKDDLQNQDLILDAKYYGLKRLQAMLQEFLYVNVGGRVFRLSWDLLKKGGTNFFNGPLLHSLYDPHDGKTSPVYIDRDPAIFEDIINHLRGYTIYIKDEMHRKNLLKDAQYYVFKQLVEKLLAARTTVDGFGVEGSPELLLLLQDVRIFSILPTKLQQQQQQQQLINSNKMLDLSLTIEQDQWQLTQLQYKRNDKSHALLVQVADICLQVHFPDNNYHQENDLQQQQSVHVSMEINENDRHKLKMISQSVLKGSKVQDQQLYLDEACAITIDDQQTKSLLDLRHRHHGIETCHKCPPEASCKLLKLILVRGICSIHLLNDTLVLCAVRLETISSRLKLNMKREFIPSSSS